MDEQNVNVVLLKKAYIKEGEQIPEDIKNSEEEIQGEKEKGKEREDGEGEPERKMISNSLGVRFLEIALFIYKKYESWRLIRQF